MLESALQVSEHALACLRHGYRPRGVQVALCHRYQRHRVIPDIQPARFGDLLRSPALARVSRRCKPR
jgi:hypothetical protein